MRKNTFVAAVYDQRAALLRRVDSLSDSQWDAVCQAPAPPADVVRLDTSHRTVRDVVAHLLVVDDQVLRGGAVRALTRLDHPGGWDLRLIQPLAAQSSKDLVPLLARRGERFGRLVSAAPAATHRVPVPGPFGRQTLCQLIGRRVLHEWLHEQDIAAATAGPAIAGPGSTAVARVLTETLLQMLPNLALPRVPADHGIVRIVVDVVGGGSRRRRVAGRDGDEPSEQVIWGIDFSRRQYGPRVRRPADATIRLDAATLTLLAHGRSDRLKPQPLMEVDGDHALASSLLEALDFHRAPAPDAEMSLGAAAS